MSAKPTNGAGDAPAGGPSRQEPAEADVIGGEALDVPIEVEVESEGDTRPLRVPDLDGPPPGATGAADEPRADAGEVTAAEADAPTGPEARVAELEREKAAAEKEKVDLYERLLRSAADLDNFRKRSRKDVEEARADARSRVLKEMLPVIDNLDRAVTHAEATGGDTSAILDGIKLVLRQFGQAFERCEVTAVEAEGKPFDPNLHEAISQQPSADVPPGTVLQVLQRGYQIGGRLLRPALVVVAQAPPLPAAASGNGASRAAPAANAGGPAAADGGGSGDGGRDDGGDGGEGGEGGDEQGQES
jgi:molecular chaperone GrpE